MPDLPTKQFITLNGQRLAYITAGDPANPPVLFIHGWLSHAGVWRLTIAALQATHYCVAVDLLGLAESDKPADGDYSIRAQAARVLALADALGIGAFTLFGHSMGGQIALYLAAHAPERVTRVVDVAGVVSGRLHNGALLAFRRMALAVGRPWLWRMENWLAQFRRYARFSWGTWFYRMNDLDWESWAIDRRMSLQPAMNTSAYRCGQAIVSTDLSAFLPKITVPVLVLFGEHDAVVPVDEGRLVQRLAPNSQFVTLPDCGHFPMYEKVESYLGAVREFLQAERVETRQTA